MRSFGRLRLSAPGPQKSKRYIAHTPAAGEIVIWDRSWYNRAGVERVMGFCSDKDVKRFLELTPHFEKIMVDEGVILLKYWLEVSKEEQTRRLEARIHEYKRQLLNGLRIVPRPRLVLRLLRFRVE